MLYFLYLIYSKKKKRNNLTYTYGFEAYPSVHKELKLKHFAKHMHFEFDLMSKSNIRFPFKKKNSTLHKCLMRHS